MWCLFKNHPPQNLPFDLRFFRVFWHIDFIYDSQVCAAHVAPRALPKGCDFGKEILQVWLGGYAQQGSLQALESKNDEGKRMLSMDVGNAVIKSVFLVSGLHIVFIPTVRGQYNWIPIVNNCTPTRQPSLRALEYTMKVDGILALPKGSFLKPSLRETCIISRWIFRRICLYTVYCHGSSIECPEPCIQWANTIVTLL